MSWQTDLLRSIGAPATAQNLKFLNAWRQAEGGTAAFNPLNTTQPAAGATNYNKVGVRNYRDYGSGIQATAQTLLNGRYNPIVQGLRSGNVNATELARRVAQSPWGTGSGVLRVLGSGNLAPPPVGAGSGQRGVSIPSVGESPFGAREAVASALLEQSQRQAEGGIGKISVASESMSARSLAALGVALRRRTVQPGAVQAGGQPTAFSSDSVEGLGPAASAGGAASMTRAIQLARQFGLSARENPAVEKVDPVHTKGSFHYKLFPGTNIGRGLDVSGDPRRMRAYFDYLSRNRKAIGVAELFYDPAGYSIDNGKIGKFTIGGHADHVHLSI